MVKTNKKNIKYKNKTRKKKYTKPKNFIFGYGSIICSKSRIYTGKKCVGKPIPVELSKKFGYVRVWDCKKQNRGAFLSLKKTKTKSKNINGVLFPIFNNIKSFDKREKGYKRIKIKINTPKKRQLIKSLNEKSIPNYDFNIYMYIIDNHVLPHKNCYISQRYLDITLSGCLEYGIDFAKKLLKTTLSWKGKNNKVHWKNDRNQKTDRKYKVKNINHILIDNLIQETIPQYFKYRTKI